MATVYAIASAKGGVGKTTTTAAVATLLAESGADVVAIDADIGMANLADALGVGPGETTIHDVLAGDAEPEAAVHEGPHGLRVVTGEKAIDAYAGADPSKLNEVVEAFADADYVLLDAGAGLSHDSTLPLGLADETLLVSTPERSALGDTEKTRQLVERLGGSVAGAALTRVDPEDSDGGRSIVTEILNADVLGRIPEDAAISRASAVGGSVVSVEPNAAASQAYRDLTRALTGAEIDDPEPAEDDDSEPAEDDDSEPAEDDDLIVADSGPVGMGEAGDEEEIIVADERPVEDVGVADDEADDASETASDESEEGRAEDDGDERGDGDEGEEEHAIDDADDGPAESTDGDPVTESIPDAEGGGDDPRPDTEEPGSDAEESGSDAEEPGSDAEEPGSDAEEPGSDVDEELAGSIPFRDDDTETMETALSRTDEDEHGTDEDEPGTDGNEATGADGEEEDDEKSGFFSRLLGR